MTKVKPKDQKNIMKKQARLVKHFIIGQELSENSDSQFWNCLLDLLSKTIGRYSILSNFFMSFSSKYPIMYFDNHKYCPEI